MTRHTTVRRSARLALIGAIAVGALALSACTGSPNAEPTAGAGKADPDASLSVGLVLEPTNLDIRHTSGAALEQILVDNIYEGLVTRTQDNEIVARLATDYEISADGLTYTFTLNDGIVFHDGSALTSADVVASYETVKTDAGVQGNAEFAGVTAITAPDEKTVTITLTEPDQNFLFALTGPAGLVLRRATRPTSRPRRTAQDRSHCSAGRRAARSPSLASTTTGATRPGWPRWSSTTSPTSPPA